MQKSCLLSLAATLGWIVATTLAFFAVAAAERMTAFILVGKIMLALLALIGIASPWVEAWHTRKAHKATLDMLTTKLTPIRGASFMEVAPRTITDSRTVVLDVRNLNLAAPLEVVGVTPSCQVPGLSFRCDTHLPVIIPAATPNGPNGSVQITMIEATPSSQPHARWFHLRVEIAVKLHGQLESYKMDLQVPA